MALDSGRTLSPRSVNTKVQPASRCKKFVASIPMSTITDPGVSVSKEVMEAINVPDILIMAIGSRGDIEAFLSIARHLSKRLACRVRVATHPTHQALVEGNGYEFYSVGGDPNQFASSWNDHPELFSSASTLTKVRLGNIWREHCRMIRAYWHSSVENTDNRINQKRPFMANVIVSSLPTMLHVHTAQKLGVPLVLVSVQPVLPTKEFPSSLSLTTPNFARGTLRNYFSAILIDTIIWSAFGRSINATRTKELSLSPVSWVWAVHDFLKMNIPHVCLWSQHLVPQPPEWGANVVTAGYTRYSTESDYCPSKDLESFLSSSRPIILVSFGSAKVPDPSRFLNAITSAMHEVGARALLCGSWAKAEMISMKAMHDESLFLADSLPHAWVLPRTQGFVHHGGAGHTAAGMRAGVPMATVPLFLDQYFWAAQIHQKGLGPQPLDHKQFSSKTLAIALTEILSGRFNKCCTTLAAGLTTDSDGGAIAAEMVAEQLALVERSARCSIMPTLRPRWQHQESQKLFSGAAAAALVKNGALAWSDLQIYKAKDWTEAMKQPLTPMRALAALVGLFASFATHMVSALYILVSRGQFQQSIEGNGDLRRFIDGDAARDAAIEQSLFDMDATGR